MLKGFVKIQLPKTNHDRISQLRMISLTLRRALLRFLQFTQVCDVTSAQQEIRFQGNSVGNRIIAYISNSDCEMFVWKFCYSYVWKIRI